MQCVNKKLREYQTLKKESGLSDSELSHLVGRSLEVAERYPYLDELKGANSEAAIIENLKLKKDNTTSTLKILEATNTDTVEDAVLVLNNKYRDKEIEISTIGDTSKVFIITRPNEFNIDLIDEWENEAVIIKEESIAKGDFMKAPNGKPSNLSENEWLYVRTTPFKQKFGDWEKEYTPNKEWEWSNEFTDRTFYDHINQRYHTQKERVLTHPVERKTPTKDDPFGFNSKRIDEIIKVGTILNYRNKFDGICQITARAVVDFLKNRYGIDSHITIMNAVSPTTGKIIEHWAATLKIDGKSYIYDMPQTEYIKTTGKTFTVFGKEYNEGIIYSKYKPRLIEVTNENLLKNYGDDNKYLIKTIIEYSEFGSDVEKSKINNMYKPAYKLKNLEKMDENGEPKREYINIKKSRGLPDIGDINNFHYFNEILDRLQTLYGINIIPITNVELQADLWNGIVGTEAKAFIHNGDIYINTDLATIDSPVHEMLHLLFGSMRYSNRAMYDLIVANAKNLDSYNEIALMYPNRTESDINEEVFVTELAKYLTGISNALSSLPTSVKHEIFYNINRTLDTIMMGDLSVKCIPEDLMYQMSLKTIAKLVNASTTKSEFYGGLQNSYLSRIMSNKKSELMDKGLLREECS